jgi:hypothetical protein
MSDVPALQWKTQAFPEQRLASLVVPDKPVAMLAKLFGVWESDIDANHPTVPEATTYGGLFKLVQEVIVDQITSLMARAADSVNLFSGVYEEARARLLELATIDAQQATLHYAQELWYHAICRDDPQATELLRDWAPSRVWGFLELAEAIKSEAAVRNWEQIESTLSPDPPTPGGPRSRLIGIPLRSVLPSQASLRPFTEADWFTKRATAATIGARVTRRKRARARAVGTRPGGEAETLPEPPIDGHDEGSGSEPEPEGEQDPLDPEPSFQRHPNQWRLWVMRRERRKAESASALRAEPRGVAGRNPPVHAKSQTIRHFKGVHGDLDRFLRALKAHFRLARIDDDMDRILSVAMLLEDRAAEWYGSYLCKIDPEEARRVHGRNVTLDPSYATWEKFEACLRSSFGGRIDRLAAVAEWDRLRQKGSIDEFLDEVDRLMWITGYKDDVVKDKLRTGLSKDLAKEWSRVHPKPDTVAAQVELLREMGHTAEDHERLESRRRDKNRDRDRDSDSGRQNSKNSASKHRHDKKGKHKSSTRKDREPSKSTAPLRDEATKGISQEVISQRKKDGVCLRCGKVGHKWSECWSKEPHKEKCKPESSGDSTSKRQKTSTAAAAATRAVSEPASDSGRIMEIPDDERDDSDFDLWA